MDAFTIVVLVLKKGFMRKYVCDYSRINGFLKRIQERRKPAGSQQCPQK